MTNVMMQTMVANDTVMIRAFALVIWLQIRIGTISIMITIIAIKIRARCQPVSYLVKGVFPLSTIF